MITEQTAKEIAKNLFENGFESIGKDDLVLINKKLSEWVEEVDKTEKEVNSEFRGTEENGR